MKLLDPGIPSDRRFLAVARKRLRELFPELPQQPGAPRAFALASPKRDEREVGIELLGRARRAGGETVIGDKGYAGREFAMAAGELDATILRPSRKNEPDNGIHLDSIRQRIESI